jgi:hypothetical protein
VRIWRALLLIPRKNPDHERFYHHVRKWFLELDDSGVPVREIGLDSEGRPLFGAPDGRNPGFWTDNPEAFEDQLSPISAEEFETFWHAVRIGQHGRT